MQVAVLNTQTGAWGYPRENTNEFRQPDQRTDLLPYSYHFDAALDCYIVPF